LTVEIGGACQYDETETPQYQDHLFQITPPELNPINQFAQDNVNKAGVNPELPGEIPFQFDLGSRPGKIQLQRFTVTGAG
jgi:hypothetical protein